MYFYFFSATILCTHCVHIYINYSVSFVHDFVLHRSSEDWYKTVEMSLSPHKKLFTVLVVDLWKRNHVFFSVAGPGSLRIWSVVEDENLTLWNI